MAKYNQKCFVAAEQIVRKLKKLKSLENLFYRAFNWLKWMDLFFLERFSSAQMRSDVAILSHMYIADNKRLIYFFKFSVKGCRSILVFVGVYVSICTIQINQRFFLSKTQSFPICTKGHSFLVGAS